MSDKNRLLVFGQLQYTKRPEHLFLLNNLLPLVLVRVSTLQDATRLGLFWSPKLMPVEHISLMPASWLSVANT